MWNALKSKFNLIPSQPTRLMSRDAQSSVDWQGRKTEEETKWKWINYFLVLSVIRCTEKIFFQWKWNVSQSVKAGWQVSERHFDQRDKLSIPATERSGVKPCQEAWHLPYLWRTSQSHDINVLCWSVWEENFWLPLCGASITFTKAPLAMGGDWTAVLTLHGFGFRSSCLLTNVSLFPSPGWLNSSWSSS